MVLATNLGFPRVGPKRELKLKAVEPYWKGDISAEEMLEVAKSIRKANWQYQQQQHIDHIPSNDFSLYDHYGLDTIALLGAVPARYQHEGGNVSLDTYFAMARGAQTDTLDVKAMEMSKWFDTNYHYIVPEFHKDQDFALSSSKIFDEFEEAKALGITTRPALLGPVSFLLIGKTHDEAFNQLDLLPKLLPVYEEILTKLKAAGAEWVQIDEPSLVTDLDADALAAFKTAYERLANIGPKLLLATYFADLVGDNLEVATSLPVAALHIDAVRVPHQLGRVLMKLPQEMALSVGIIDGRNIWKSNFSRITPMVKMAIDKLGSDRVLVGPSCSLLHSPVDLDLEEKLDPTIKDWFAFAKQKVTEISVIARYFKEGESSVKPALEANAASAESRETSSLIHKQEVKERTNVVTEADMQRNAPYIERHALQKEELPFPLLPTTTIGSYPQTKEVRQMRAKFRKGDIDRAAYQSFLEQETEKTIAFQEEIGIDVLVHGEFERNDMVEYFGEKLEGFTFTQFGWVQSYGSRCVKPPIIFGDVSRPAPMTVEWARFAQSKTEKPMKGMLTGPVTILQWSFVRNDQPRSETCKQIALAIRDEVIDLEKAGIKVIQIDEAALREGLPIHRSEWANYLKWAVESFRISASGVQDSTQIHTHMCYSEFNDIIKAVADMDADVISIETSRSQMELLDAFVSFQYPNEIGPGVYDIHSPRVPNQQEMEELLTKALEVLKPEQVWVNPDCGLKTRGWEEVKPALVSMVNAATNLRQRLADQKQAS